MRRPVSSSALPEACGEEPRVAALSLAVEKLPIRQQLAGLARDCFKFRAGRDVSAAQAIKQLVFVPRGPGWLIYEQPNASLCNGLHYHDYIHPFI